MTVTPASSRRAGTVRALLALALAAGTLLTGPAALAAEGGEDDSMVTWTVRTASNDLGSDRTFYEYAINPGSTVEDALVISNRGDEAVDVAVYAADGFTTDSGQLDLLKPGEESAGIGAWTATASDRVSVAAGSTVTVPFTVTVPENATPGDYAGGVVTSLTEPSEEAGVNVDRRLGIRMNVRVGGELQPSLTVQDAQVSWNGGWNPFAGGDATVTYTLHNAGNVALSAQPAATVGGPFGWFTSEATDVEQPPQLLPGESWKQSVTVPGIAPLVLLTAGLSITPVVTDVSGSTGALAPVLASATGWAVPWTLLILLLLVVAAAILVPRILRRRRRLVQEREDARVAEAVSRALEDAERPRDDVAVGAARGE